MGLHLKDKRNTIEIILIALLLYFGFTNYLMVFEVLQSILNIITPFLIGGGIAFVLNVPMKSFEKLLSKRCGKSQTTRGISLLLAIGVAVGLVIFVLFMIIPELIRTISLVNKNIPGFLTQLTTWVDELFESYPQLGVHINELEGKWADISKEVLTFLQSSMSNVLSSTLGIATSVFSAVFNLIIGIIFACYILVQKDKLSIQIRKILYAYLKEERVDRIIEIGSLTNKTFSNFIMGQCTEAVIFGVLCFSGMTIFQFPYALTISVLVGFTALIPMFGALIGIILGALLIVVVSPLKALWFIIFVIILQQLEGNLIYPKVVGGSVGLPGMWVMVAVTVGGSTMGLLGMLIFVPLASVIYCLQREAVNKRIKNRKITQQKLV